MKDSLKQEIEDIILKLELNCSIDDFSDKVDWNYISEYQKLSEKFIREFKNKINWSAISKYQKLSEDFIREFKDRINWSAISIYQKLSEEFIREFIYKIDWHNISINQKLSEEFRKEFNISILETNWLYKSIKFKEDFILKNTEFKIKNDDKGKYIIAYKSIRNGNYSVFNFQYKYEVGKTYELHCDCNIDGKNSFGLSSWTKEKARNYYSKGKLIKVKIYLEDIGCIIKSTGKIRSFKLEVLRELNNESNDNTL